jgi:proteasome activator subunit 4
MQDYSDQELQVASKRVSQRIFPQVQLPLEYLEPCIQQLVGYLQAPSDDNSRHLKTRVLPALQIVFFRNLYLLKANTQEETLNSIVNLLYDSRLEVRRLASVTLSGLVRCSQRGVVQKLRV